MKRFLVALVCSLAGLSPVLAVPDAARTGEWSKAVNGLQGRLVVTEGTPFNGTAMPLVYLELRNVSDVLNAMEIYYDTGRAVKGQLTDEAGNPPPPAGLPADIMMPLPYWLALPFDGTLRFRVSVNGYGVPKDQRSLIGLPQDAWLMKAGDDKRYFLSGTFHSEPPQDPAHIHAWKGSLDLPKVGIP